MVSIGEKDVRGIDVGCRTRQKWGKKDIENTV